MNKVKTLIISILAIITACKVQKTSDSKNSEISLFAKPITVVSHKNAAIYQASRTKEVDLLHTNLKIKFDYNLQHAFGKINLKFKPHFYATKQVVIDAKGMELKNIGLINKKDTIKLNYTYDTLQITIELNKTYFNNDTFNIFIDYVSKPNELNFEGSAAIKEAKGLYFVNPKLLEANKSRQIWTQGETESNSCWMPTIDAPNQKHTQELYITAQANEVTLSNGKLISITKNADGTHTDYWKQTLPHAPYLTMMAIGEFNITKHNWHDSIEVSYYLEKDYAQYASLIFGPTKEMLDCFSKKLGVDYPWEKFSQIIVRDFVSGAMENTSAVLHGEYVQHDNREHLDNNHEDVIAHEMFHHWFGDLTTAESWSNLPLNESFATYGEYIWNDWKYGNTEAEAIFDRNLSGYLLSKNNATKTPIRFYYHNREDMFDGVSYSKGARILHQLRKQIGDDAFFKSLQLYLNQNKFKSAEIHNLRLAFEETTGLDLNWYFNQWFLNAGHPELDLSINYNDTIASLTVVQKQDSTQFGLYQLPVYVNIFDKSGIKTFLVNITKTKEKFTFKGDSIYLLNFDTTKALVSKIDLLQSDANWYPLLKNVNHWKAKQQAILGFTANYTLNKNILSDYFKNAVSYCLNHNHPRIIELGYAAINSLTDEHQLLFENNILALTNYKNSASVRGNAVLLLNNWNNKKYKPNFEIGLQDSSNQVLAYSLFSLNNIDSLSALQSAEKWRNYNNYFVVQAVSNIVSKNSIKNENVYFEKTIDNAGYGKRNLMFLYAKYLIRSNNEINKEAIHVFERLGKKMDGEEKSYLLFNTVNELKENLITKNDLLKNQFTKNNSDTTLLAQIEFNEIMIKKYEDLVKNN
jgi:aminopeptidase N